MEIREAQSDDVATIARIYNQGIEDRVATLETELRTADERRRWLADRTSRHPVLVAVDGGAVVGWASLNRFNPRAVYDHVADFSVYVDRDRRGVGIGTALLTALEESARSLGYHKLVLAALLANEAGTALYRRCGFREVGVYREQGLLDDTWVDVLLMEKILA
jgi:L-amino acid N-acyltransferase YncA